MCGSYKAHSFVAEVTAAESSHSFTSYSVLVLQGLLPLDVQLLALGSSLPSTATQEAAGDLEAH